MCIWLLFQRRHFFLTKVHRNTDVCSQILYTFHILIDSKEFLTLQLSGLTLYLTPLKGENGPILTKMSRSLFSDYQCFGYLVLELKHISIINQSNVRLGIRKKNPHLLSVIIIDINDAIDSIRGQVLHH